MKISSSAKERQQYQEGSYYNLSKEINKIKQSIENEKFRFNDGVLKMNPSQKYAKNIGVIRGQWFRHGKLKAICYGTAFAISKRVILTCGHSVFLEKNRTICHSATFIPNFQKGKIGKAKTYKTAQIDFIKLQSLTPSQSYSNNPIPEDIALLYLSEDLQIDDFPKVGLQSSDMITIQSQLFISGYPSANYYSQTELMDIHFQRQNVKGKLLQISNHTIYHNLQTKTGHSGSAIIGFNTQTQEMTIIGVHTHKGRRRNSGVYLNMQILKRLISYEIKFGLKHPQYDMSIKFPQKLKLQVISRISSKYRPIMMKKIQQNKIKQLQKNIIQDSQQQLDSDYQCSMMQPFLLEKQFNPEVPKDIKISEKDKVPSNQIQKQQLDILLNKNNQLRKQAMNSPKNTKALIHLMKMENFILQFLIASQKSQKYPQKQQNYSNQIKLYENIELELSKLKNQISNFNKTQIQIVCRKILTIQQHFNNIYQQKSDDDDNDDKIEEQIFNIFKENSRNYYQEQYKKESKVYYWKQIQEIYSTFLNIKSYLNQQDAH